MKRIISKKKTALPSLRNQEWKTVKSETEKINNLLTNILKNNIADLNNLIYAGAKLVCEKVGLFLKNKNKMAKLGWEIRLEKQFRNLWQQAKMIRQKKIWDVATKRKKQHNYNKKMKDGRLKRYHDRTKQYRQNRTFQNN